MNASTDRNSANQSIARRLTAGLAITVLVVSAIALTAMYFVVSQAATRGLEQRADETLAYLVGTLEMPLWTVDYDGVKAIGAALANDASIGRLTVRNESGAVVYTIEKKAGTDRVDRFARIIHKQEGQDRLAGDVSVSLAQTVYSAGNRQLLLSSAVIIFLILASVLIVTVVLIRVSLKQPLQGLKEIAERFAAGTYDTSGQVLPYLEFQPFGGALAQMAKTIEAQIRTIREAEGRYRDIVENALEGIFQTTVEGKVLSANPALARTLGYDSPGELIAGVGDVTSSLYVDREQRDELLSLLRERSGVTGYETQLRRKDGEAIWVFISARMVRDDAGRPLSIEGFLTDITERRLAEEDLRRMNERFALAANAGRMGVWDWDIQKNELVWDDRMYALYGVRKEDFAGAYEAWLNGVHPDDRAPGDEASRLARSGERPFDTEFRVVWPDGSIHHLKAYGQVVRAADGSPLRMTGVNFDITERKQSEEEIRKLNQELERRVAERTARLESANKELETLTYSVSHDLRQPLRHIDGFLGRLKKRIGPALDEECQRYMATISEAALRMAALIDDLLSFSRTGRFELTRTPIDLRALVQEIVRELAAETSGRAIDWHIGELPVVAADRAMLRVALVNLISNAVKFTRPRERAEIEIGCQPGSDGEIIVFVRDNGVGFDMKYAHKLFRVFERLHGFEEFEGTGIGLANVRRVINRHGGRTWAEGKVDGGATFYFSLPQSAGKTGADDAGSVG